MKNEGWGKNPVNKAVISAVIPVMAYKNFFKDILFTWLRTTVVIIAIAGREGMVYLGDLLLTNVKTIMGNMHQQNKIQLNWFFLKIYIRKVTAKILIRG